ncbi:MAG TPA: DCC1-like thiol-disulfide oxidoreductase family protein [Myxococcaceae bacterium]|nr:DCC1-like thiol-disulfide oxidoreductase family protein [Myxococcaceae bacterium]
MTAPALLLWDGECGFCRRSVEWAERRDEGHAFRAIPYQQAPSPPMTAELRRACARAVHVLTSEGQVLRAGRACLWVLQRTGYPVLARVFSLPPLVWGVELGYWLVARNRWLASRVLFRRGAER